MPITTMSSREFNQEAGKAKKAAGDGPVIITDRGKPAHVLLTYEDYQKLSGAGARITDLLAVDGLDDEDFLLPAMKDKPRPADLS